MAFSAHYATAALGLCVGRTAFVWSKHWWNKRTLREIYIAQAATVQVEVETVHDDEQEDFDSLAESYESSPKPDPKKLVRHKGVFRNYLVQKGKAKFGCPSRSEANRLVIRKHLHDVCVESGLLARHIAEHVDIATELVFVPSRTQITAAAIRHTALSSLRTEVFSDLTGPRPSIA